MKAIALDGAFTALVTPFTADGSEVDWEAFERLIGDQLEGGIRGLVPCGTTGETPTLSDTEQREIIRRCARLAGGKVPVLAGTGSNSTKKTIDASRAALEAGADGVMVVMPYYNKPSQTGLARHVEAIANAVDAPVVLYNIPGRSVVDLATDTLAGILDGCPNVVGIKDATGNVLRCQEVKARFGDRITVVSGDDALTLGMMAVGASGVISVSSNVVPGAVADFVASIEAGRWDEARRRHYALLPLHRAMFVEPNPAPAKAALAQAGKMTDAVRLPIVEASADAREIVRAALSGLS